MLNRVLSNSKGAPSLGRGILMKIRVLSLALILLVLLSLCGVVNVTGAALQAQPARPNEVINNSAARTGSIPTKIVVISPGENMTAHIGQPVTMHLKLIRSDTGAGIPNAVLNASVDINNQWHSIGGLLVTDSNGDIGPITVITPDPRPIVKEVLPAIIPVVGNTVADAVLGFIKLPMTAYVLLSFAGDSTYAGSATQIQVTLAE